MNRKVLLVGDVHATPEELADCRALMNLVREIGIEHMVDEICLLGDSYHTMNVIRAEVLAFWREMFEWLGVPVVALVGNHDFAGEGSPIHAMIAHEDQIQVVDKPLVKQGVLYLPYYSDREAFVAAARANPTTTLVCHQTFEGAKYENGIYAKDGVDPDLLPQKHVISGHIHTPHAFGKVRYIGAPRWRSLPDANVDRAVWLYDFDAAGDIRQTTPFDTGKTCRQIRYVLDTPEKPFEGVLDPGVDWRVDIRGPAAYVDERKKVLAGPGVRVRAFKVEKTGIRVRESDGIDEAFKKYLVKFRGRRGTPPEVLARMAMERLGVEAAA